MPRSAWPCRAFNEAELREAGFRPTAVVPPAAMLPAEPAPAPAPPLPTRRGSRWLSVGRLAPNKAIELAVMALLVTRAHHDPQATLDVVGRSAVSSYTAALQRFVDELGLHAAVTFSGALSDDALVDRLRGADLLVATSRHEGFGVPVLEAMSSGLPVVANEAGALPEVVGDAGLLVDAENPYALAEAAVRAAGDGELRARLAVAAQRRLAALDLPTAGERAADVLSGLWSGS